jgi:regulator of protease activity HflC (stomatin/prohibitin superfamily)
MIVSFVIVPIGKAVKESYGDKPDPEELAGQHTISKWVRVVAIIFIVIGFFIATVRTVPAGYRGVLLRFGAVNGVLTEGIHIITPYVNDIQLMEVRTLKETAQASAASKDLQVVSTTVAINFHVDPAKCGYLYKTVGNDFKSRVVDPAVQESLKQVTAKYTAEELIKMRSRVKIEVESEVTRRLKAYNLLVESDGVSITQFDFSQEFNTAIESKQVAQQDAEKQKYVLQQAKLQKETDITKAEGESQASRLRALALKSQGGNKVIAEKFIEKWDGKYPLVVGSSGMILDLKSLMSDKESVQ